MTRVNTPADLVHLIEQENTTDQRLHDMGKYPFPIYSSGGYTTATYTTTKSTSSSGSGPIYTTGGVISGATTVSPALVEPLG